jgi:hypothetical protein
VCTATAQARLAFESGALVFQYEADVKTTKTVVQPILLGSSANAKQTLGSRLSHGPVDTLNAVAHEGWEFDKDGGLNLGRGGRPAKVTRPKERLVETYYSE